MPMRPYSLGQTRPFSVPGETISDPSPKNIASDTATEPQRSRLFRKRNKPPTYPPSTHATPPLAEQSVNRKTTPVTKRTEKIHQGISTRALVRIVSFSLAFVLILTAFGLQQKERATVAIQTMAVYHGQALDDLATSLQRLEDISRKLPYVNDPATMNTLTVRLSEEALFAQHHLEKLPVDSSLTQGAHTFLTQLHQYGIQLSRRFAGLDFPLPLPAQTIQTLSAVQEDLQAFAYQMVAVRKEFASCSMPLEEALSPLNEITFHDLTEALAQEEALEEVPFPRTDQGVDADAVDSIATVSPTRPTDFASVSTPFSDAPTVTLEEARAIATQASGIASFEQEKEIDEQAVASPPNAPARPARYQFQQGAISVEITQQGGFLYQMSKPRSLQAVTLSETEARRQANIYLTGMGMPDLHPVASSSRENFEVILFAFAPQQDDVFLYTDMVQIGIALDTGEIVWVDASSYLRHHGVRENLFPTVPLEVATQKISPRLTLDSTLLCLRPAEKGHHQAGISPVLCYELTCSSPTGTSLRYYVNAITGAVEDLVL